MLGLDAVIGLLPFVSFEMFCFAFHIFGMLLLSMANLEMGVSV